MNAYGWTAKAGNKFAVLVAAGNDEKHAGDILTGQFGAGRLEREFGLIQGGKLVPPKFVIGPDAEKMAAGVIVRFDGKSDLT